MQYFCFCLKKKIDVFVPLAESNWDMYLDYFFYFPVIVFPGSTHTKKSGHKLLETFVILKTFS